MPKGIYNNKESERKRKKNMRELGLLNKRKKRLDVWNNIKKIKGLYTKDKKTIKEISKYFECSTRLIRNILKENKIKTNSRREKIVSLNSKLIMNKYMEGCPIKNIVKSLSCSYTSIYNFLKDNGIKIQKRKDLWNNKKKIIRLYNEGKSIKNLSYTFNCGYRLIQSILRKNNIKIKPQKFYLIGKSSKLKLNLPEKKIMNLYINKEKGIKEIANLMKCDQCVIKRILQENNIKIRPLNFYTSREKNYGWNSGSSFKPYGLEFNKKLKKLIKERDGCCMLCNIGFEDLKLLKRKIHIHHINYDKKCNLIQNLITLCQSCHSQTHINRKHWSKFFQSLLNEKYNYQYFKSGEIILNLDNKFLKEKI